MKATINALKVLPQAVLVAGLIVSTQGMAQQHEASFIHARQCNTGYEGTWIIGRTCDLGGATNIKTDDAIHVQCDIRTGRWSIDFYEEPTTNTSSTGSQAQRLAVCPGNGFITKTEDGREILQCNYWESVDNVAKQLEFELEPAINANIINMLSLIHI